MNSKSTAKQANRNKSNQNKRNSNSNNNSNNTKSKDKMVITTSTEEAKTGISHSSNSNNNNSNKNNNISKMNTNSMKADETNNISDNVTRTILNKETKVNNKENNNIEETNVSSVDLKKLNDQTNSEQEGNCKSIGDNNRIASGPNDKNDRSANKKMKNIHSVLKEELEKQESKNTCEMENVEKTCQDASEQNQVEVPAITLPANLRTYINEEESLKLLLGRPNQLHKKVHGVNSDFTVLNSSGERESNVNDINRARNNNIICSSNKNNRANNVINTGNNKIMTSSVSEKSDFNAPHLSVDRSLLESLMSSCKYPIEIEHDGDGEVKLTRELLEYLVMAQGVQDGLNDFASTREEECATNNTSKRTQLNDIRSNNNSPHHHHDHHQHNETCRTNELSQGVETTKSTINTKECSQSKRECDINSNNNKNISTEAMSSPQPHLDCTYFPPLRCVRTFSSVMPIPFSAFNPIRRSQHTVKLTPTQEENVMRSFDKMLKTCHGSAHCTIQKESSKCCNESEKNITLHEEGNLGRIVEVNVPDCTTTTQLHHENAGTDRGDGNRQCAQVDCHKKLANEINEPLPFVSAFFDQHCPEVRNYLSGIGNEESTTRVGKSLHVNSSKVRRIHNKYENSGATYLMLAVITGHTTLARRCLEEGCANPNNMSFLRQIGEWGSEYDNNKEALHDETRKRVNQTDDYSNNSNNNNKNNLYGRSGDANANTTFAEHMYNHFDSSSEYNYMKREMQFNDMLMEMKHGYSPLYMAIIAEQLEIAEMLYSFGGSVHIYDRWGRTPLHAALTLQSTEVVQWLLSKGAPRYVPDCFSSVMPTTIHDCIKHYHQHQHQHYHQVCNDISASSLSSIPALTLCGFPVTQSSNNNTTSNNNDNTNHHHEETISDKVEKVENMSIEGINGQHDASSLQSNTTKHNKTVIVSDCESTNTHKVANDDETSNDNLTDHKQVTHDSLCQCHSGRVSGYCGCVDDMFIRWKANRLRVRWSLNMNLYKLATDVSDQKEAYTN